jgi:hypothetical protein
MLEDQKRKLEHAIIVAKDWHPTTCTVLEDWRYRQGMNE